MPWIDMWIYRRFLIRWFLLRSYRIIWLKFIQLLIISLKVNLWLNETSYEDICNMVNLIKIIKNYSYRFKTRKLFN